MKKLISKVLLFATVMCVVFSLCSCFATGVEGAAKEADEWIEGSGYDAEHVTSLEYFEDTDTYVYSVKVYRPETPVLSAFQVSGNYHSGINGFFSDYDNVTIKVDVYDGEGRLVYEDE